MSMGISQPAEVQNAPKQRKERLQEGKESSETPPICHPDVSQ